MREAVGFNLTASFYSGSLEESTSAISFSIKGFHCEARSDNERLTVLADVSYIFAQRGGYAYHVDEKVFFQQPFKGISYRPAVIAAILNLTIRSLGFVLFAIRESSSFMTR